MPTKLEIDDSLKGLLLKDLRIQCRARGINPGGNRDALLERVRDHMLETSNFTLITEYNGEVALGVPQPKANRVDHAAEGAIGINNNNYNRTEGQNVGNFITDRPSSRVLAPPGGVTSWSFGGEAPAEVIPAKPAKSPIKQVPMAVPEAAGAGEVRGSDYLIGAANLGVGEGHNNNYSRPSGQNVGNFMTDKPSSRVLAPPGGSSSIVFG